ncbi:MAG: hypothetical protein AMXMBFR36_32510 [Acidobacteriota bacterium]
MARPVALLPAALLALFAFACGGFASAAGWPAGPAGTALLLALGAVGARAASDPLRLGRVRWLVPALWLAVALSVALSPVPRAGWTALVLLPALLMLPAVVGRGLADPARRRTALAAWSAVVAVIGAIGLHGVLFVGDPRAARPLGHHNLLAAFLVVTLPVALLGLRERGGARVAAAAAALAGIGALAATRSLGGLAAAAAVALLAAPRLGRGRHLVAGAALLAIAAFVPRGAAILSGVDSSGAARRGYAAAAIAGWSQRPVTGHGAGSTPWRLAEWMRPVPGVHPPGELVGEAHSLPFALLFELGAVGAALACAVAVAFVLLRWRERAGAADPGLLDAGLLGVAGGLVASLSDAWLAVPALPVALAASAGAALAGAGRPEVASPRPLRALALGVLAIGAAAEVRPALAWRAWESARSASDWRETGQRLAHAVRLDPSFPLYRARWAWTADRPPGERAAAALDAARAAGAVAPFWVRAGSAAFEAGDPAAARTALERAMALDPLSPTAPFLLHVASGGRRLDCAARAMLSEPRLAAATAWRDAGLERAEALALVRGWPGVDAGWRRSFTEEALGLGEVPAAGGEVDLAVEVDRTPALAMSLHLFRRSPLRGEVSRIRLDSAMARRLRLPSAATLATSSASAFPPGGCAPEGIAVPRLPERDAAVFQDSFESGDAARWRGGAPSSSP